MFSRAALSVFTAVSARIDPPTNRRVLAILDFRHARLHRSLMIRVGQRRGYAARVEVLERFHLVTDRLPKRLDIRRNLAVVLLNDLLNGGGDHLALQPTLDEIDVLFLDLILLGVGLDFLHGRNVVAIESVSLDGAKSFGGWTELLRNRRADVVEIAREQLGLQTDLGRVAQGDEHLRGRSLDIDEVRILALQPEHLRSDILRVVAVFDKIDDLKTEFLDNAGLFHDVDGTATILVVAEHQHNPLTALGRKVAQSDDHLLFVGRPRDERERIFLWIQHFAGERLGNEGNAVFLDLVAQRLRRPGRPAVDHDRLLLVGTAPVDLQFLIQLVSAIEHQHADLVTCNTALCLVQIFQIIARSVCHPVHERVRARDRSPCANRDFRACRRYNCKCSGDRRADQQTLHASLLFCADTATPDCTTPVPRRAVTDDALSPRMPNRRASATRPRGSRSRKRTIRIPKAISRNADTRSADGKSSPSRSIASGRSVTNAAPTMEPVSEPRPPTMIIAVWSTERPISKASGFARREVKANSPPHRPAKKPLSRNAFSLVCETSMPMPRATSSLSRTTRNARPTLVCITLAIKA